MGARKASSRVVVAGAVERTATPETPETPDMAEILATPAAADGEVDAAVPGMAGMAGMARVGYAPIVRVDVPRREIELCATSEAVDSHGTIFDYAASREAFTRWIGNVREMHGRQAVGSRVGVRCDDAARRIYVRIRISRGARDTWEKVLDGTLRGASIGASGVVWRRERRRVAGEQRWLNVATRYDLVELSLVDNPSNPDALGITFVRDATPDVALLDVLDELDETDESRAAATGDGTDIPSAHGHRDESPVATTTQMDQTDQVDRATRERLHGAARAVLVGCGCSTCVAAGALLDDVPSSAERMARDDDQPLARALAAGLAQNATRLNDVGEELRVLRATLKMAVEQMSGEVVGMARRVAALESQPLPGGPVARPGARPVEKASAFAGRRQSEAVGAAEQYRALESLAGRLRDPQAQVAVAAELIRLQQSE